MTSSDRRAVAAWLLLCTAMVCAIVVVGGVTRLVYLLPFLWFLLRRRIDGALAWKLWGVFALGALQGALGWYMVMSGLVEDPRVSQFRLTAHLGVALAIIAAQLWIALELL